MNNHHNSTAAESSSMRQSSGIAMSWTTEEHEILVHGLATCSMVSSLPCYVKIASLLENKTVRDVAIRAKWLYNKEISKRRTKDHNGLEVTNSTPASHRSAIGEEYEINYVLLKKNEQLFNQISANFTSFNVTENLNLLSESLRIIKNLLSNCNLDEKKCEPMKRMPSLPVKLNEELYNSINPPIMPKLHNDGVSPF